jgi:hypothetical protein
MGVGWGHRLEMERESSAASFFPEVYAGHSKPAVHSCYLSAAGLDSDCFHTVLQ